MAKKPPVSTVRRPGGGSLTRIGIGIQPLSDLYHFSMTARWPAFLGMIAGAWLGVNLCFALVYFALGDRIAGARPHYFPDAFFFSIQTMSTIGYGGYSPRGLIANSVVTVEALAGLLSQALVTGLIFAKFARPTARVLFSKVAVIARRNGVPTLQVRMANERASQIVEASIHLAVLKNEVTAEGERVRRVIDLPLVRENTPSFILSWTAIHVIDEKSPFHRATTESLKADNLLLIASLMGTEETLAQTVHARTAWRAEDIRFGARFVDVLSGTPGGDATIDYTRFHEVVPE